MCPEEPARATVRELQLDIGAAWEAGRFDDLLALLKRAVALYPDAPEFRIRLARELHRCQDYSASAGVWVDLLLAQPQQRATVYANAAAAMIAAKLSTMAQGTLRAGIALHPDDAALRIMAGTEARRMGDIAGAIEQFAACLKVDPGCARSAKALEELGRLAAAARPSFRPGAPGTAGGTGNHAAPAVAPVPEEDAAPNPASLREAALQAGLEHRFDRAAALWLRLSELEPSEPAPLLQAAGLLRIGGFPEQGEALMQRAMAVASLAQPAAFWGGGQQVGKVLQQPPESFVLLDLPGTAACDPRQPSDLDAAFGAEAAKPLPGVRLYPQELRFLARFLRSAEVGSFFEVGAEAGGLGPLLQRICGLDRTGIALPRPEHAGRPGPGPGAGAGRQGPLDYAGDLDSDDYMAWRSGIGPFDFVLLNAGECYCDVRQGYLREMQFRPRFIGFTNIWNIAHPGCKHVWDQLDGKVAAWCNTDASATPMAAPRAAGAALEALRSEAGYCTGIGIVRADVWHT